MTPTAPHAVDSGRFRAVLSRWATGVSVVTAHGRSGDAGLTVNALLSVSLDPPSLLVSLSNGTDTLPVVDESRHFGVSFLSAEQRELSERFALAVPSAEKFPGVGLHRGPYGSPLLDGAIAALECRLAARTPAFDHTLLLGEVVHLESGPDRPPLVFYRSGYASADGTERLRLPSPRP